MTSLVTLTSASHHPNNHAHAPALMLKIIMQGKEVGSIIGKKGDNVKRFREESGAKINISDASCPERVVSIAGSNDQILSAFSMITNKLEEDIDALHQDSSLPKPPITLRLVVPASQCGCLIGKAGTKIKEIREATGASIQVASDLLPNSTERAVTISGCALAIMKTIQYICTVMVESPPKGATIPYRPKPAATFVMAPPPQQPRNNTSSFAAPPPIVVPQYDLNKFILSPGLIPTAGFPVIATQPEIYHGLPNGIPSLVTISQPLPAGNSIVSQEITIPNDLVGCVIGRGGSKINEIRQLSGASIKISGTDNGGAERKVTISGVPQSIVIAQRLISSRLASESAKDAVCCVQTAN